MTGCRSALALAALSLLTLLLGRSAPAAEGPALFAWRPWLLLDSDGDSALAMAVAPDGKTLACGNSAGEVRIWETATGDLRASFQGKAGAPLALAYSADGRSLWLAGREQVISWDLSTRRPAASFRWDRARGQVAVFGLGTGRAALGEEDGTVTVWDTAAHKVLFSRRGHNDAVLALAFTPDASLLASGSADGTVQLWELDTGKDKALARPKSGGMIRGLAFAPDGRTLAGVGGRDGATLWTVVNGRARPAWPGPVRAFHSVAFSPDGTLLAAGALNGTVEVWPVTGKVHASCRGHAGLVHQVAFADDRTVASACADGMLRLWEGSRRVSARTDKLSRSQLQALLRDLHGEDEGVALRAVLGLAAVPRQAVPLLRETLGPQTPPEPQHLAKLLGDLDNPRFAVRDAAARELEQTGPVVRPMLRKALETALPLEVRRRLTLIVERLDQLAESRSRQALPWAIVVLERIGDADARKLLADLSVGTGDELVGQEAQAALRRLQKAAAAQQ